MGVKTRVKDQSPDYYSVPSGAVVRRCTTLYAMYDVVRDVRSCTTILAISMIFVFAVFLAAKCCTELKNSNLTEIDLTDIFFDACWGSR